MIYNDYDYEDQLLNKSLKLYESLPEAHQINFLAVHGALELLSGQKLKDANMALLNATNKLKEIRSDKK